MTTQSRPLDPTPSPTEVPERFGEEVLNDKNFSAIDEIAADDYVEPDPRPGQAPGRDGLKAFLETKLFPAFPDGQWIDEEQGAEGDKVVTRFTFYGTHQGTFMGIPPTGRRVAVGGTEEPESWCCLTERRPVACPSAADTPQRGVSCTR
jgi:hypothetical protein